MKILAFFPLPQEFPPQFFPYPRKFHPLRSLYTLCKFHYPQFKTPLEFPNLEIQYLLEIPFSFLISFLCNILLIKHKKGHIYFFEHLAFGWCEQFTPETKKESSLVYGYIILKFLVTLNLLSNESFMYMFPALSEAHLPCLDIKRSSTMFSAAAEAPPDLKL